MYTFLHITGYLLALQQRTGSKFLTPVKSKDSVSSDGCVQPWIAELNEIRI